MSLTLKLQSRSLTIIQLIFFFNQISKGYKVKTNKARKIQRQYEKTSNNKTLMA